MTLTTVTNRTGPHSTILAEHHNELVSTLTGLQNELVRLYSNDDGNYGVIIKNTGTGSKGLLVQDAAGATLLDVSSAGTILSFADGSAAAPSIRFGSDTDTGLYRIGSGSIGVTLNAVSRTQFHADGGITTDGGLFIHGTGVHMNQLPTKLVVQNITSTDTGYALAAFNYYSQATTGDNVAVGIIHNQTGGGVTSQAQTRCLDLESFRQPGVSSQMAVGDKCLEMGIHLGSRIPYYVNADTWYYQYGTGGSAVSENEQAKCGIFYLNDSVNWFPAGTVIGRAGTFTYAGGTDGVDYFDIRDDETQIHVLQFDHMGSWKLRPAAWSKVWYDAAGVFSDQTTAANTSRIGAADSVNMPTGNNDRLYLGLTQRFHRVWFEMGLVLNSYAGAATFAVEYWNGTTWASVASNQPANGSVVTNTTQITNGPFERSGSLTFAPPENWAKTIVNGSASLYWIRMSISGVASGANGVATRVGRGERTSMQVYAGPGDAAGSTALAVRAGGDVWLGGAALGTTAVAGYPMIPTTSGAPIVAPNEATGRAALIFRTDTNQLYAYNPVTPAWVAI